jgi:hypothetical protein
MPLPLTKKSFGKAILVMAFPNLDVIAMVDASVMPRIKCGNSEAMDTVTQSISISCPAELSEYRSYLLFVWVIVATSNWMFTDAERV